MPRNPRKVPCGVPGCRAWAVRRTEPPRCSPHGGRAPGGSNRPAGAPPGNQNRLIHGLYASVLRPEELAKLGVHATEASLDAEIAVTRVALCRLLGMLLTGTTPGPKAQPLEAVDYARCIGLTFQGASAIARLLRTRHDMGGDREDGILSFFDEALDLLNLEFEVDL